MNAACIRATRRGRQALMICMTLAANSRRAFCIKVGATFSIGTLNWKNADADAPSSAPSDALRQPDRKTGAALDHGAEWLVAGRFFRLMLETDFFVPAFLGAEFD